MGLGMLSREVTASSFCLSVLRCSCMWDWRRRGGGVCVFDFLNPGFRKIHQTQQCRKGLWVSKDLDIPKINPLRLRSNTNHNPLGASRLRFSCLLKILWKSWLNFSNVPCAKAAVAGKKRFNDGCLIHGKSGTAVTVKHIPSFVGAIIPAS